MKRTRCSTFWVGILLLGLGLAAGCSDTKNGAFLPEKGHVAGWVLDGHSTAAEEDIVSCEECHGGDLSGGISSIGCTDCHLGGPTAVHPLEWTSILSHGPYAASNGTDACSNVFCHGPELAGVEGSGPSCSKCHPWPFAGGGHGEGWVPSGHAVVVRDQGSDQCKVCHGDDFSGGIAGVACSDCHLGGPTSPHPTDWGTNILFMHGGYVNANGPDSCANVYCHGTNLDGIGGAGPSCSKCHSWPPGGAAHPEGWVPAGHVAPATADITICQVCHGTDFGGGTAGVACTVCHLGNETSIHPLEWGGDAFTQHRAYVMQNGTDRCANVYCHGPDLGGVVGSGPSCSTCHTWPFAGTHPNGWVPSGHKTGAQQNLESCKTCHGTDFSGGIAGVACSDCHLGSPTSFHPVEWGGNALTEHRAWVLNNSTTGCSTQYCHGVNLDGLPPAAGPSCSTCHSWPFESIHPAGWVPSGHVTGATADIQSCTACHGTNFEGGIGPACTTCHMGDQQSIHPTAWGVNVVGSHGPFATQNGTSACSNQYCHGLNLDGAGDAAGPSCSKCHSWPYAGGHPAGWVPSGHEAPALADIVSCQLCHGADYSGGSAGVACTSCHMGNESNIHPVAWGGDVIGQHRAYAIANGTNACSNVYCHGGALAGVVGSGPSCSTCHAWPVGHLTSTWLPSGHKAKAQTSITSCQACHGADYMGGSAGVACVDCHLGNESSVHPLNWTNPIQDHRAYAKDNGVGSCSNVYCHGTNLTGASGPSCFTCHGQEW